MCRDTPAHQVMGAVMAMNIFPHTCDTGGKLQSSAAPSSGDDLVNKTYADAGGGGGGGFSVTSISANVTIGDIQSAFNAASSKEWSVSPSGLTVPSGKTLLGIEWELQNTLGYDNSGSWAAVYATAAVGIDDPSGQSIMPTLIGGAWNGGANYNQPSPYLSAVTGPSPGWYYQDSSWTSHYVINDGTTTTDYVTCYGSGCLKVSAATQVKVFFYEDPSQSKTFEINSSATASSSVVVKVSAIYA